MLSDILRTRFVVHYKDGLQARSTLDAAGLSYNAYDTHNLPYVGFSVWCTDVDGAVEALLKGKVSVVAVDGDVTGEFSAVPRKPVMSYGRLEGTNYGSLYYKQTVKHKKTSPVFIEDGQVFRART